MIIITTASLTIINAVPIIVSSSSSPLLIHFHPHRHHLSQGLIGLIHFHDGDAPTIDTKIHVGLDMKKRSMRNGHLEENKVVPQQNHYDLGRKCASLAQPMSIDIVCPEGAREEDPHEPDFLPPIPPELPLPTNMKFKAPVVVCRLLWGCNAVAPPTAPHCFNAKKKNQNPFCPIFPGTFRVFPHWTKIQVKDS
jgi:hypothetical protein